MSELKVNKISPSSGTAFTIGDSGDTFTVPSGATLTVAGTFTQTGAQTFDGGVDIDNFNINGSEIDLSSGDLTVDVAGDIILDADGGEILFHDATTAMGHISMASSNITLKSLVSDKDIIFQGNDGGSGITALTLDMSDAGTAVFNHDIKIADDGQIGSASAADAMIISSGGIVTFKDDILIKDGGTIGSASDADSMAIAANGVVTFSQIPLLPDNTVATADIQADAITEAKIADDAVESEHLNNNIISGQTALGAAPADTDEFLVSDAGTIKRVDYSYIKGVPDTSTAVIKGWVSFNGTSTVAITQSYNCSSITDNATGSYSVNWSAGTGATGSGHASCGGGDLDGYNNDERVNVYNSGNNQSGVESWNGTTATDMSKLAALTFGNGS